MFLLVIFIGVWFRYILDVDEYFSKRRENKKGVRVFINIFINLVIICEIFYIINDSIVFMLLLILIIIVIFMIDEFIC